jgi:hypothetical protein
LLDDLKDSARGGAVPTHNREESVEHLFLPCLVTLPTGWRVFAHSLVERKRDLRLGIVLNRALESRRWYGG